MEKKIVLLSSAFACGLAFSAIESVPLKTGWKFIKADDPQLGTNLTVGVMSDTLDRANRGDFSRAPKASWCAPAFDDKAWKAVRVPHDWGVEKGFDGDRPYGDAFLDVTGVGWYRTSLTAPESWRGKTVYFECDGAMSYSHVWINGHFVGGWPYGYTRFRLDLTPHLAIGGTNVIAIRCHNEKDSSRWYSGGGLYRNCRLLVCPPDHVVPGSVHITTPEVTAARAKVRVSYTMSKGGARTRTFTVEKPRLWDIDDPYLYSVDVEGNAYRYGIRTISFNADERRFQLNGRTVPLNGACMHHDFGVLGAAWNRSAQKRRLLLFKEAGVNAIRSSHNPPDEGLLELCDELGILVKDEVFDEWRFIGSAGKRANGYTNLFDVWHERDVRAWVRTDRNHPCVIMYSLGNEICDLQPKIVKKANGFATSRALARIVASEDNTRPTTNANNTPVNYTNEYPTVLAVMGCNYFSWQYPALKKAYPDVPFFGSETICMGATRGYFNFPVKLRGSQVSETYDLSISSYGWEGAGWSGRLNDGWAVPADVQWHWMDRVGTCMGEFIWTGIDYLGGPYWCEEFRKHPHYTDPARQAAAEEEVKKYGRIKAALHTCDCGFLDLAGFKKDTFWLYQARWRPNYPSAHILPHWNWPERVGKVTPVYVFTSGDEGELFLNGKSLGRQRKQPGVWDRAYRLRWDDAVYQPGRLEVVTYKNGCEWARDSVETAGPVAKLQMASETATVASDGEDVAYVNLSVRDAKDCVVPRVEPLVTFSVSGPGEIVATDNGYEGDMDDFHGLTRRVFNGWLQAIVRAKPGASGPITVTAKSDGLASVSVTINAVK